MNTMTEAELKIANILWDEPGISAVGFSARCEDLYGWKRSTAYTLRDILPPPTLTLRGGGFSAKNANAFR